MRKTGHRHVPNIVILELHYNFTCCFAYPELITVNVVSHLIAAQWFGLMWEYKT